MSYLTQKVQKWIDYVAGFLVLVNSFVQPARNEIQRELRNACRPFEGQPQYGQKTETAHSA